MLRNLLNKFRASRQIPYPSQRYDNPKPEFYLHPLEDYTIEQLSESKDYLLLVANSFFKYGFHEEASSLLNMIGRINRRISELELN